MVTYKQAKKRSKLTTKEIAKIFDVDIGTVRRWENGDIKKPPKSVILCLMSIGTYLPVTEIVCLTRTVTYTEE